VTRRGRTLLVGAGTAALLALFGLFTSLQAPGPLPRPSQAPRGIMGEAPPRPCPGRLPLSSGVVFHSGAGLTPPQRLVYVPPVYPPTAIAVGVGGTVIVEAIVDREGIVRTTRVLHGIPLLDEAAVASVCQSVFTPAKIHGEPIAIALTINVEF
jgi:TonB family protein